MRINRYTCFASLFAFCLFVESCFGVALAISDGPLKIVVPASPGTGADIVARLLAPSLSEVLGQSVVIENNAGAGGSMGASSVALSAPNGHTLMMGFANHVINPSLYKNLPFDIIKDFKPIVRLASAPLVIVVNPSFPASSLQELIGLARARPKSDLLIYGSTGTGTILGLTFEILKQRGQFDLKQVPYKGTAQMVTDVVGNFIPMGAPAIATALPLLESGKLKAIGVTSIKRSASLPDVPTIAEQGFDGYDVAAWNGLFAPKDTPDEVVTELYNAVLKATQGNEFADRLVKQAMDVALMNPSQFKIYVRDEVARWSKIAKEAGVEPE
jgi:tripartite-type tricarboxylate transporter receptor subunit TctC